MFPPRISGRSGALIALWLLLPVVACDQGGSSPALPPPSGVTLTMNPNNWVFRYSPNMPAHPSAHSKGWQFSFPTQNGVHYLVHPYSGQFNGVAATFRIEQNGTFVEVEPCVGSKPAARLYFQRRGDNLGGQGEYEFYRWWSVPTISLDAPPPSLSVPADPSFWLSVYGKKGTEAIAGFQAALADTANVGITYGGCFAGHGVYVNGAATFIMKGFSGL